MTDVTTNEPLRIEGRTIRLPLSQSDTVEQLFQKHGVRYWVSDNVISWEGGPEQAFIYISKNEDETGIQAILDSVP